MSEIDLQLQAQVADLLYREARHVDQQRWDEWLELFTPDCEFWVPAWKGEHTPTEDPQAEVSLVYYSTRAGLEDRVWRIRSGQSVASTPVPRTTHLVGNIRVDAVREDGCDVSSSFQAHSFFHKTKATEVSFGLYEHRLVREGGQLRIARKKVVLMNDYIPTMLDLYNI